MEYRFEATWDSAFLPVGYPVAGDKRQTAQAARAVNRDMSYHPSHRKLPRQERWPDATPGPGLVEAYMGADDVPGDAASGLGSGTRSRARRIRRRGDYPGGAGTGGRRQQAVATAAAGAAVLGRPTRIRNRGALPELAGLGGYWGYRRKPMLTRGLRVRPQQRMPSTAAVTGTAAGVADRHTAAPGRRPGYDSPGGYGSPRSTRGIAYRPGDPGRADYAARADYAEPARDQWQTASGPLLIAPDTIR